MPTTEAATATLPTTLRRVSVGIGAPLSPELVPSMHGPTHSHSLLGTLQSPCLWQPERDAICLNWRLRRRLQGWSRSRFRDNVNEIDCYPRV